MKFLKKMLQREIDSLPKDGAYVELRRAFANEPLADLITIVRAVASQLANRVSPTFKEMADKLDSHADRVQSFYDSDREHAIAQSWATDQYRRFVAIFKERKEYRVKETGHTLTVSPPVGESLFMRLRQPMIEVRYKGLLKQYGPQDVEALGTVIGEFFDNYRQAAYQRRWVGDAHAKAMERLRSTSFLTCISSSVYQNAKGQILMIRPIGEKMFLNFQGQIDTFEDEERFFSRLEEVLNAMADQHSELLELSIQCIEYIPGLVVTRLKDGFTFTATSSGNIKLPEISVKTSKEGIIVSGFGSTVTTTDREDLAKRLGNFAAKLIVTADSAGLKECWSKHIIRRMSEYLRRLPLYSNMEAHFKETDFTIQLKDHSHGFNVSVDGDNVVILFDGYSQSFSQPQEEMLFDYLGFVMKRFQQHGKKD